MSKLSRDYLIYTFLIMLVGWGTCIVCSRNNISIDDNFLLYIPYLLGGWSPTIASFIVLKKNNYICDFKEWIKNIFDFKHSFVSYLLVIGFAMIHTITRCLISGYENGAPIFAIVVMIPLMLFMGGLEEAGWRYILQPELEKKFSFFTSTIIVGVIWWLWHMPLFYIQGVGQNGHSFLNFGIDVIGISFVLACIRRNTSSVWLCVLFHCIVNSLAGIYMVNDSIKGNLASTLILICLALVLVKISKNRKIYS